MNADDVGGMGFAPPVNPHSASIVEMTSSTEEMEELEATFRGQKIDENGKLVQIGEPMMNNKGVSFVVGFTRSLVNRNSKMSNTDDNRLGRILYSSARNLAIVLMHSMREFEIKSNAVRSTIVETVVNMAEITILRSLSEGERRFWKGSTHHISYGTDQGNQQQMPMSNGLFNKLGWQ